MNSYLSCFQLMANKLFLIFNNISKMYKQMVNNNNKHNKVVSQSKKNTKDASLEISVKMKIG